MIKNQLIIDNDEYYGDFDLNLTINSGQTSQPPFKYENGTYQEIISIDNENILINLTQDNLNEPLIIDYVCKESVDENKLLDKIYYIFDLNYDITEVYDYLNENNELNNVYKFNKGLRLFKAQFPYECIISSICSANNSIKRWTNSIQSIKENIGAEVIIGNQSYFTFPNEETFLKIPEEDLKEFGVGYRSSYMLNSTKKILLEKDFHKKISNMDYNSAFDKIIELEGVGPKVADCILLYGYDKHEAYPVDVWINRITTYLYFKDQKPSNKKIMNFAQDKFGDYAGYVQLYLFNYARSSGLMDKLKNI
ncbi:DNA glycosylase [Methanosphaera sp.]